MEHEHNLHYVDSDIFRPTDTASTSRV